MILQTRRLRGQRSAAETGMLGGAQTGVIPAAILLRHSMLPSRKGSGIYKEAFTAQDTGAYGQSTPSQLSRRAHL
jgi:hypothetical protein